MLIRAETIPDRDAVHAINTSAFETSAEAELVDVLRDQARPIVSLVAEVARDSEESGGGVVGHILFSPVSLEGFPDLKIMGLAPMAIAPAHQRKGIGSALVREGLKQCKELGIAAVVVLGHPNYYPRFGFVPSIQFGIDSEYDVPPEVFMAMELLPQALTRVTGKVKYHPAFGNL